MLSNGLGQTPTGALPAAPKHAPWLTGAQYMSHPHGLDIQTSDPYYKNLDQFCATGCAKIEGRIKRYVTPQTVDETFFFADIRAHKQIVIPLKGIPITSINKMWVQYISSSFVPLDLFYLTVDYAGGAVMFYPELSLGSGSTPFPTDVLNTNDANVWINYEFGVSPTEIPEIYPELVEAAVLETTQYIALKQNPIGATTIKMGSTTLDWKYGAGKKSPIDEEIDALLQPYISKYFLTI